MGKEKSKSTSTQTSQSSSDPLNPTQVAGYWSKINELTGGRLNSFANTGTPATSYNAPTDAQIAALGGQGELQRRTVNAARAKAIQALAADPSLSVYQRLRATQDADQQATDQLTAIDKEAQAAATQAAFQRSASQYTADTANNQRLRDDIAALAEIFFGGKGQTSQSTSTGTSKSTSSSTPLEDLGQVVNFGFKF